MVQITELRYPPASSAPGGERNNCRRMDKVLDLAQSDDQAPVEDSGITTPQFTATAVNKVGAELHCLPDASADATLSPPNEELIVGEPRPDLSSPSEEVARETFASSERAVHAEVEVSKKSQRTKEAGGSKKAGSSRKPLWKSVLFGVLAILLATVAILHAPLLNQGRGSSCLRRVGSLLFSGKGSVGGPASEMIELSKKSPEFGFGSQPGPGVAPTDLREVGAVSEAKVGQQNPGAELSPVVVGELGAQKTQVVEKSSESSGFEKEVECCCGPDCFCADCCKTRCCSCCVCCYACGEARCDSVTDLRGADSTGSHNSQNSKDFEDNPTKGSEKNSRGCCSCCMEECLTRCCFRGFLCGCCWRGCCIVCKFLAVFAGVNVITYVLLHRVCCRSVLAVIERSCGGEEVARFGRTI